MVSNHLLWIQKESYKHRESFWLFNSIEHTNFQNMKIKTKMLHHTKNVDIEIQIQLLNIKLNKKRNIFTPLRVWITYFTKVAIFDRWELHLKVIYD